MKLPRRAIEIGVVGVAGAREKGLSGQNEMSRDHHKQNKKLLVLPAWWFFGMRIFVAVNAMQCDTRSEVTAGHLIRLVSVNPVREVSVHGAQHTSIH